MTFTFEDMKEKIKYGINYGNALECFVSIAFVTTTQYYNRTDENGIAHPISYDFTEYSGKINDFTPIKKDTVWSTEGLWGNPETTKDIIQYYAEVGFTAIRLPVNLWWHRDITTGDTNKEWLNYVRSVVDMIIDAGMFCLIDVHCENYASVLKDTSGDYADLDSSIKFTQILNRWIALADTLKDIPEDKLSFELLNEFAFGKDYATTYEYKSDCNTLSSMYSRLITAIRETGSCNTDRLIGIDGYRGNNGITARNINCFSDILDDKRNFICATGYLLAEFTFCYNESFGKKVFLENEASYDIKRVNNDMQGLIQLSKEGYNVIVVEYGTHAYNDFTGTDAEVTLYKDGCVKLTLLESLWFDKLNIPAFAWDSGYVIDRKNITIKSPDIYNAIFRNADQDRINYLYSIMKK